MQAKQRSPHKPLPVRALVESAEKWLDAVNRSDIQDAWFHVTQVTEIGKMLAYDPEFLHFYQRHKDGCNLQIPAEVLDCIYAILMAVSDAGCSGEYRQPIQP